MVTFFIEPYKDELLYSIIGRYHYYSGNTSTKDTLNELFGTRSIIPSIEVAGRLEHLCNSLNIKNYDAAEKFINSHTIFPYYSPFLPQYRRMHVEDTIRYNNANGLYAQLGIMAGSVCKKKGLYYCPACVISDMKEVGEPYFHRLHQLQGVLICPEHLCTLKRYPIFRKDISRIDYIILDYENIDLEIVNEENIHLVNVVQSVKYLFEHNLKEFDQAKVWKKYRDLLERRGFLTYGGTVKQRELYKAFKNYYGDKLLDIFESNISNQNEWNWLKSITRKPKKVIHPIRNILFIIFLCGNLKKFFEDCTEEQNLFGKAPWLCLNPAADHYMRNVITNCVVTKDFKTNQPVGTFTCSCGYIYSRRGPDIDEKDKYKIGRIKSFGAVWESKLKDLLNLQNNTLRGISKLMGCDPKTIIKYAKKLGLDSKIQSKMKNNMENVVTHDANNTEERYMQDIIQLIKQQPELTRTEIREKLKKQYAWFYRNNKGKLNNLLLGTNLIKYKNIDNNRVDWEKRDCEIKNEIKEVYKMLIKLEKPIRITKSIIGRKIGKLALLELRIDKLPRTKEYLELILESIEDFQIRKIKIVSRQIYSEKRELKKWEIIKKAGLKFNISKRIDEVITKCISKCKNLV